MDINEVELGDQRQLPPFHLIADQSGSMESDIEFLNRHSASTAEPLRKFIESFDHTIVRTDSNLASGKAELPVFAPPRFMSLDAID